MHGCPQPGQLLPATLRFEQQISQMWPMYSLLRLKGYLLYHFNYIGNKKTRYGNLTKMIIKTFSLTFSRYF